MSRFARWIALLIALGGTSSAFAQKGAIEGFCNLGGSKALVSGLASTNYQQGIIPSCTVTVYVTGTQTLASLYSNSTGTPLANPFTANTASSSAPGQWIFFADVTQEYDVVLSGGIAPNAYPAPVTVTSQSPSGGNSFVPLAGGTMYGPLFAPNINGELYPASCGLSPSPSWCSGTTADAWIRAACTQLPATGGIINFLGLGGTIAASVPCSTPTKQVVFLADNTSTLNVTETDGGTVFPLDNGSMFLGQGAGQCLNSAVGGIHLASGSSVKAIVGPAHIDGSQENFTADGLCLFGHQGAAASQGIMLVDNTFANTEMSQNVVSICNTACIKVINGGAVRLENNWANVTDGDGAMVGVPLLIQGTGLGGGCNSLNINVTGGQYEHATGGGSEITIEGDGAGAQACNVHLDNVGIERVAGGSTVGIKIQDCVSCSVNDVIAGGAPSGAQDLLNISETAPARTESVAVTNVSNIFDAFPNTLNDTVGNTVLTFASTPLITTYYSAPGYQQPPVLPGTVIQSVGTDAMGGLGTFSSGDSNFGTSFSATGCNVVITCVFTRTNSSPPPGLSFSQEVQITANADPSGGFNGVQYGPTVSFTAGAHYVASFWGKGDGTFTGLPTFLLWNSATPVFYCQGTSSTPFTTTWTLYSFSCAPTVTGSAFLAVTALTPVGQTGTFWVGGFVFSPVQPLPPNSLLTSITPYGIGAATDAQKTATINSVTCEVGGSCTIPAVVGTGTTGTITGTALTATCDSGTVAVTNAVVGHPVAVSSTTGADVGGAFNLRASVTSAGTVTVYVCGTGTPASLAYDVTVF